MTTTPFSHDIFEPKARSLFDAALDDRIVKCLLDLMQEKHEPTLEHSLGVSRIMSGIVTSTCVKDVVDNPVEFVRDGLLHDIGKFVVDKRTLNWPGRLGEREMAEIKAHPLEGYRIVRKTYETLTGKVAPNLGTRILLSHYAQPDLYPAKADILETLANDGIDPSLVEDTDYMIGSIGLDIANHFEARFPIPKKNGSAHGYGKRKYPVEILPQLVTASFLGAEAVNELGFIDATGQLDERLSSVIAYCGELAVEAEQIRNDS